MSNRRPARPLVCLALASAAVAALAPVAGRGQPAATPTAGPATRPGDARPGWRIDPAVQADLDRRKVPYLYREEGVPAYALPDPLLSPDGSRAATREQWERRRRPETLDLFRRHVYGRPPADPARVTFDVLETDPRAMGGAATLKRVRITSAGADGKSFAFEAAVLTPNAAAAPGAAPQPAPAFLLINNRPVASADPSRRERNGFWPAEAIVARGYAAAVFRTVDVDPDEKGNAARARGVRGVWPAGGGSAEAGDAWATIGAWAWGASRVMDYLQADPAVDARRVAAVGHSRGGKTALWAAAQDERFALAVSNDSGEGGAALARRRFGETVEAINRGFPYWFCANYKSFNGREDALPVDQHQLVALLAGRAVYVASADADLWADPRGEFLSLAHASSAFGLYGEEPIRSDEMPPRDVPLARGQRGYHVRAGGHNLTPYDWDRFMDFADRLWGPAGRG